MKKREAFELWSALESLKAVKPSPKFGYAMARNREKLKPFISSIQEAAKFDDPEFSEYEKKRQEIVKALSKGEDGKPTMKAEGGRQSYAVPPERLGELNEQIEALQAEYAEMIERRKAHNVAIEELLDTEMEEPIKFHKVSLDAFPDTGISQEQYNLLLPLIDEEQAPRESGATKE